MLPANRYMDRLLRIAGLCAPVPTLIFVTSKDWAELAAEVLRVQPKIVPDPSNFKELRVPPCLTVVNSGTEDQAVVDEANRAASEQCHFLLKREALISGKVG